MKGFAIFILILIFFTGSLLSVYADTAHNGTFSIVAFDPETGELGVAVESKFFAVGTVVPFAEVGIGAIATQSWSNMSYGPEGLALLKMGISPEKVVDILTSKDNNRSDRQLGIVDAQGKSSAYTGDGCHNWAEHIVGNNYSVQGNILAGEEVVKEMSKAFEQTKGTLAERMLAALEAGQKAGGDRRGQQSASILVVRKGGGFSGYNDRYIDLRVDDNPQPISELKRLFHLHEGLYQAPAHVQFGVEFLKQGQKEKADHEFGLALAIADKYPNDADLYNNLACEFAFSDVRPDDALRLAKKAVELAPKDGNIWDTLGDVYFRRGEYKEAINAESKAIELEPNTKLFGKKLEEWKKKAEK